MNSKNISKKNSVFSKLGFGSGFGWVQAIAVLVVMGMVLSCGDDATTPPSPVVDLTPTGLNSTNITSTKVELEWDIVEGANFYWIFYTETTGGSEVKNQADTNEFATPDTLTPKTEYKFEVQACDNLKCSERVSISVTTLSAPIPATITYPNMDSTVSATSMPEIVNSDDCDLRSFTNAGSATFSIDTTAAGNTAPTWPTINAKTGEVNNNGNASPGTYKVTVTVAGNTGCNGNAIVYNTITPADKNALTTHIFEGSSSGVLVHGYEGNFNYIDTSKVTNFSELFRGRRDFNGDISGWDTSQVTNMTYMFSLATSFDQPLSNWNTSKVKDMRSMFFNAAAFNQPIGGWDTAQVESMEFMFLGADKFNQPIGDWITSKVQDMSSMFKEAKSFDQPIGGWDTSKVEDMRNMFLNAAKFDQDLSEWDVGKASYDDNIFQNSAMHNKKEYYPELWK